MNTVLVVDNEPFNIDLVATILKRGGFKVVGAATGQEAIEKARRIKPAIVLMDLQLPGMDGFEATTKLLADSKMGKVKVLAFSALTSDADKDRAKKAGCAGYITKPVGARELIQAINQHL